MDPVAVFEEPGVFSCSWYPEAAAIVGQWRSFGAGRVRECVTRHIAEGGARRASSCIVDVTGAGDVMSAEDATWVDEQGAPMLFREGIPLLVNVVPAWTPDHTGADRWAEAVHGQGVTIYTCGSLADALAITRAVSPAR